MGVHWLVAICYFHKENWSMPDHTGPITISGSEAGNLVLSSSQFMANFSCVGRLTNI